MAGSGEITSMEDLLLHGLQDMYYAENQILKSIPEMIEKASNPKLKQMFEQHQRETRGHVERIEKMFEMHGKEAKGKECPAMDGIIREGEEIMGEVADPELRDVAIIGAAQAVEHYEITRYGTLAAWAKLLGKNDVARLIAANLKEEKATDKKLSSIAKRKVNKKALARSTKRKANGAARDENRYMQAMAGVPAI